MSNSAALLTSLIEKFSLAYRMICSRTARHASLALFDQCIVSGSRFVTTVLIGRVAGAEQLGEFALAFSLALMIAIAQETLVSTPYTLFCNRYEGKARAEFAGSVLAHCGGLTLLVMAGLALFSLFLSYYSPSSDFGQLILILATITPFLLLREFARRFAFAHLRMRVAVAVDLGMAIVQICGLIWLAAIDSLSAINALWVIGLAAAVSSAGWLIYDHQMFSVRWQRVVPEWLRNWSSGKWLFGGSMVSAATGASLYWILALMSGLTATGIFAACMAIVQFANPVVLGLSNVLEPSTARAFAEGGHAKIRQVVQMGQLSLAIVLTLFCTVVIFMGADVIAYIYHGSEYANHDHTVIVLAFSTLVAALELAPSFGLRVMERSNHIFFVKLLQASIIFIVLISFVSKYGMLSAAYALLAGSVAGASMLSLEFFRQVSASVLKPVDAQSREMSTWHDS